MIGKDELEIEMSTRIKKFMEDYPGVVITYDLCFKMCAEVAMEEFDKHQPVTKDDLRTIFKEITARHAGQDAYLSRGDVMVMLSCIKGIEDEPTT